MLELGSVPSPGSQQQSLLLAWSRVSPPVPLAARVASGLCSLAVFCLISGEEEETRHTRPGYLVQATRFTLEGTPSSTPAKAPGQ